jgi:hypothetical protein
MHMFSVHEVRYPHPGAAAPAHSAVTAVIDAGGASRITSAQATLSAFRPALLLITGVSALGAIAVFTGLRPARYRAAASVSPRQCDEAA